MMKWILAAMMLAACAGPPPTPEPDEQTESLYETDTSMEQAAPDDWIAPDHQAVTADQGVLRALTAEAPPTLTEPEREPATEPDPIDYCWPDQVDVTWAPLVVPRVITARSTQTVIDGYRWRDLQRRHAPARLVPADST